jgi:hypothetical protein
MAADKQTDPVRAQMDRDDILAQKIAASVSTATASAILEVERATRLIENRNPPLKAWNNPGGGPRPTLTRETYFCSHLQREGQLSDEEIELFNQVRPGRYHNRKWEVIERPGSSDGVSEIDIRVPAASVSDRMELPALSVLLREIVAEGRGKES